jgi:hypothetical protein
MKRPIFAPLLAALAFASCETAHKAAVSTYRVVAAPVTYVGHKLGVDEENQQTTTTETSVQSSTRWRVRRRSLIRTQQPTPPPPAPVRSQPRHVSTRNSRHPSLSRKRPPLRRVVKSENPPPANSTAPSTSAVSQNADLPYAKPVPGKQVTSLVRSTRTADMSM